MASWVTVLESDPLWVEGQNLLGLQRRIRTEKNKQEIHEVQILWVDLHAEVCQSCGSTFHLVDEAAAAAEAKAIERARALLKRKD